MKLRSSGDPTRSAIHNHDHVEHQDGLTPQLVCDVLDDFVLVFFGSDGKGNVSAACMEYGEELRTINLRVSGNDGIERRKHSDLQRLLQLITNAACMLGSCRGCKVPGGLYRLPAQQCHQEGKRQGSVCVPGHWACLRSFMNLFTCLANEGAQCCRMKIRTSSLHASAFEPETSKLDEDVMPPPANIDYQEWLLPKVTISCKHLSL